MPALTATFLSIAEWRARQSMPHLADDIMERLFHPKRRSDSMSGMNPRSPEPDQNPPSHRNKISSSNEMKLNVTIRGTDPTPVDLDHGNLNYTVVIGEVLGNFEARQNP